MFLAVVFGVTILSTVSCKKIGGKIAFTAGMTHSQTIEATQALVFKDVSLNLGNGYDPSTGVFTAPKNGIYVFHYQLVTQKSREVFLRLCKNNVPIVTAYGYNSEWHASAGNSAVMKLKRGDTVIVRADRTAWIFEYLNAPHGTFTGFLN